MRSEPERDPDLCGDVVVAGVAGKASADGEAAIAEKIGEVETQLAE